MRIRKTASSVLIAGLTLLGTAVAAPAAYASGYGCNGGLVWQGTVTDINGAAAGTVYDYFDGTNNCSSFVKSTYSGTPTATAIAITNSRGQYGTTQFQNLSYWAGPASTPGVGVCVSESVAEKDPNGNLFVHWFAPWHSCGT